MNRGLAFRVAGKEGRIGVSYETRLQANGCDLSIEVFQAELMDAFHRSCPAWSVDELVCHPRDAIKYRDEVRAATKSMDLPDDLIRKILMGLRKH
jgi:hypothetical protein